SALAACCMSSLNRPANASCSTAPLASARPWRCRRRRTPVLRRPVTSGAASTPRRRPAGRWRADRDAEAAPTLLRTLSEGRVASPLGFTLTGVSVAQLHFQLSDGCNAVAGEIDAP